MLARVDKTLGALTEDLDAFRKELADLTADQRVQKQAIESMETARQNDIGELKRAMGVISAQIEARDKASTGSRWQLATLIVTVGGLTVGANAFYVDANVTRTVAPIDARVTGLERMTSDHRDLEERTARSQAADARSELDRSELNRRIGIQEDRLAKLAADTREENTKLESAFAEAETQFKSLTGMVYHIFELVTGRSWPIIPRESPMYPTQRSAQ